MLSEEKMGHIVHLMLDGIYHADMVDFPKEEEAMREAKKICNQFIEHINTVGELARKRILTQKSPPLENTSQWETLYQKYFDEELRKRGG